MVGVGVDLNDVYIVGDDVISICVGGLDVVVGVGVVEIVGVICTTGDVGCQTSFNSNPINFVLML